MTPRHIAEAANQGDDLARKVWIETASYLAVGIVNVVFTADVSRVVIAGGVAQVGEPLFTPLRNAVAARTSRLKFDVSQIVPAQLPSAGLVGAAQWARERG
jgi:glucokinase